MIEVNVSNKPTGYPALVFGHFPMTAERSKRIAQRALALGEVTPSDAPCKGVRPIGVSIPNIAFVEGDPVTLENFLDLIANLLGTQERPIGRLFQGESLLMSTQG